MPPHTVIQSDGTSKKWAFSKKIVSLLERENAGLDIIMHRDSVPGIRIWCGPTIERDDLAALGPWLDWGYGFIPIHCVYDVCCSLQWWTIPYVFGVAIQLVCDLDVTFSRFLWAGVGVKPLIKERLEIAF